MVLNFTVPRLGIGVGSTDRSCARALATNDRAVERHVYGARSRRTGVGNILSVESHGSGAGLAFDRLQMA
jgi:hypothetical protein